MSTAALWDMGASVPKPGSQFQLEGAQGTLRGGGEPRGYLWWRSTATPDLTSGVQLLSLAAWAFQASTYSVCAGEFLHVPVSLSYPLPCSPGAHASLSLNFHTSTDPSVSCTRTTRVKPRHKGCSPTCPCPSSLSPGAFVSQVMLQGIGPQVLDDDLAGETGQVRTEPRPRSTLAGVTRIPAADEVCGAPPQQSCSTRGSCARTAR